jgi:hypothetical protein
LLTQHGEEGGKEGSEQTRVEDGLNADDCGIWAIPLRERSISTSWDIPKRSAGDNLE